jgi:hypothetical protein
MDIGFLRMRIYTIHTSMMHMMIPQYLISLYFMEGRLINILMEAVQLTLILKTI